MSDEVVVLVNFEVVPPDDCINLWHDGGKCIERDEEAQETDVYLVSERRSGREILHYLQLLYSL
jgi:hypothetical protein